MHNAEGSREPRSLYLRPPDPAAYRRWAKDELAAVEDAFRRGRTRLISETEPLHFYATDARSGAGAGTLTRVLPPESVSTDHYQPQYPRCPDCDRFKAFAVTIASRIKTLCTPKSVLRLQQE